MDEKKEKPNLLTKKTKLMFKDFKEIIENINKDSESVQEEITNKIFAFINPKDFILLEQVIAEIKKKWSFVNKYILKKFYVDFIKEKKKKEKEKIIEQETAISSTEKEQCENWLNLPDKKRCELIFKILDFLIVGEEKNKKLIFFLKFGDLYPQLMSLVGYKRNPYSKKNLVIEVLKLIPSFVIYRIDGAFNKALLYDTELHEKIKIIYIHELVKKSPIIDLLKIMYDYDPILKIVEKDEGKFATRTIKLQKTGLIITFSFEKIPKDLQNRIWLLNYDQSYKQTEAIMKKKLLQEKNIIKYNLEKEAYLNKINFVQHALMLLDFTLIPFVSFSDQLKPMFSNKRIRMRRDIDKFINLIKIITLFNQRNRRILEVKNKKYVFSEFEDLRLAIEIGMEYFFKNYLDIDDTKKYILNFMETGAKKLYTFKSIYENFKEKTTIQPNQIRYKLKGLEQDGYISINRQGKGKASLYKKINHYEIIESFSENKEKIDQIVKKSQKDCINFIEEYGLKTMIVKKDIESD